MSRWSLILVTEESLLLENPQSGVGRSDLRIYGSTLIRAENVTVLDRADWHAPAPTSDFRLDITDMNGVGGKISKACEPCRRRKMKCSGEVPCCQRCQSTPAHCVYRLKPRTRGKSSRPKASPREHDIAGSSAPSITSTPRSDQHLDVYHSVAATNDTTQSVHSSQLFYGPSSNFAFLQQIHRNILTGPHGPRSASEVQEGGPGLDMFMQRSIFFGTPSNNTIQSTGSINPTSLPIDATQAKQFLEQFKITYLPIMGLLPATAIDALFQSVFGETPDPSATAGRAITFAALAIGALGTKCTDLAEVLFQCARREAYAYEEYVSLPLIRLSMLLAEYQLTVGRPNAAYLHLGTACRKAYALGLHQVTIGAFSSIDAQDRCHTLWCLYFFEV